METFNGVPIRGTETHRECLKFRLPKTEKDKTTNRKKKTNDKRKWLDHDSKSN
jgi:hypothetical protein